MKLDPQIRDLFAMVERYVMPLIDKGVIREFSSDENRVLALQNIHRLNQRIGQIARTSKAESDSMKLLQMYVNNLTIALKNENNQLGKSAFASLKSLIDEMTTQS